MGISIGSSYLTASISNDRINEMLITHAPPHMSIWGKIKDFFFATGEREALDYLFKLCNPTPDLTSSEIEDTFFRLKALCSPGYKERFCHNHIDSSSTGKLHIKDENGDDLLYIEMNGEVCNYNILGKLFVFEDNIKPWFTQEHETNINGLSITHKKIKSQSLVDNIVWMKNDFYHVSYESNNFQLDFKVFYDDVINYLTSVNKSNNFHLWREEEKETYISSIINKEIDTQVSNKHVNLSKKDKDDIFNRSGNNLGVYNLKLNSKCAQSSIKHMVLNLINKNESFYDFINKTATDRNIKNVITTDMVNALSNHIFEDMFMYEMSLPHDWIHVIRKSVGTVAKIW
ncbi:type III secrection system effector, WxxxE family [Yersinia pekkanenii]|uniref:Secreted effector protein sifA n=1 Tax=Yersinia pekkanenii TaxID=1288385 RepID=A0A0T9RMY1_9GAMM|nr:hypothetical protein [Yersinia pekkanenii]CNI72770.1 Secreted effector protein sifA [Yersinia pekkanenii]CRY69662.1 Secreted effector protein sifA [Yersinia pekkanenii]